MPAYVKYINADACWKTVKIQLHFLLVHTVHMKKDQMSVLLLIFIYWRRETSKPWRFSSENRYQWLLHHSAFAVIVSFHSLVVVFVSARLWDSCTSKRVVVQVKIYLLTRMWCLLLELVCNVLTLLVMNNVKKNWLALHCVLLMNWMGFLNWF